MGDRLNLSLFVVFLSLLCWGWLWGPIGVFLAIPMTTSLKVIIKSIPSTSRFALLFEKIPPAPKKGREEKKQEEDSALGDD